MPSSEMQLPKDVFAASLPRLDGIDLLPYHSTAADKYARMNKPYKLAGARSLSEERMAEIEGIVRRYDLSSSVG